MMRPIFCLLILMFPLVLTAQGTATDTDKSKVDETSMDEDENLGKAQEPGAVYDFSSSAKEDRDKLLKTLKTDVEPHLIKADVDRMKRQIMRLGSYRMDWVKAAQEFLIANASMAELYLYQLSMVKNSRLNSAILDTLLNFPSLRYPRAALAFFSFFVVDRRELDHAVALLDKAVVQDPALGSEVINLLGGSLGDGIGLASRLKLARKCCDKGSFSPESLDIVRRWRQQASSFWERVSSVELESCVRGL